MNSCIYHDKVQFSSAVLKDLGTLAGIDIGSTLTKIVFIKKGSDLSAEHVTLQCLTYRCDNYREGLIRMKEEAELPSSGTINCSGVGSAIWFKSIREVLGLEIHFVPEQICARRGLFLTLKHAKHEDVLYPTPPYKAWIFSSTYLDDFYQSVPENPVSQMASLFPAGIVTVGSGACIGITDASGRSKFLGYIPMHGKCFIGLAKLLLGTTDYNKIISLASKGNRQKTDYQIRDIIDSHDSAYGHFPPDMPVFAFGKASKDDWSANSASVEDMAASLVAYFASGTVLAMTNISLTTGLNRFFVCGNFTRAELVRSFMLEMATIFKVKMEIFFVSIGHCGAIGAMLATPEDTVEKWIVGQLDLI